MLIRVPHSDNRHAQPLTQVTAIMPDGTMQIVKLSDTVHVHDFKLPVGVGEDEVDVYSIFLGRDQKPAYGCGPVCLKRATKVKPVEPAPVATPAPAPIQETPHVEAQAPVEAPAAVAEPLAVVAPAADVAAEPAVAPVADAATDLPAPAAVAAEPVADPAVVAGPVDAAPVSEPASDAAAVPAPADALDVTPAVEPAKPEQRDHRGERRHEKRCR